MVRKFYNFTCTVYSLSTSIVRGSSVQVKTSLYSNIPCAMWERRTSYGESSLATQTNSNSYEVNLEPAYSVQVGHIIEVSGVQYKVDDVIPHHRSTGQLDNYQVFVSKTTND